MFGCGSLGFNCYFGDVSYKFNLNVVLVEWGLLYVLKLIMGDLGIFFGL